MHPGRPASLLDENVAIPYGSALPLLRRNQSKKEQKDTESKKESANTKESDEGDGPRPKQTQSFDQQAQDQQNS